MVQGNAKHSKFNEQIVLKDQTLRLSCIFMSKKGSEVLFGTKIDKKK